MIAPNRPPRIERIPGVVPIAPGIRPAIPRWCPACGHKVPSAQATPRCGACDAHMTAHGVEASPQHAQRRLARAIERWTALMRARMRRARTTREA